MSAPWARDRDGWVTLTYGESTVSVPTPDAPGSAAMPVLTHTSGDIRYWTWHGHAFRTIDSGATQHPWWTVDVWTERGWIRVADITPTPPEFRFEPGAVEIAARMIGAT